MSSIIEKISKIITMLKNRFKSTTVETQKLQEEIPMEYQKNMLKHDNEVSNERDEFLLNYDQKPHVDIVLTADTKSNNGVSITFIGLDGKIKNSIRDFTEEEMEDYKLQFAYRRPEIEAKINALSQAIKASKNESNKFQKNINTQNIPNEKTDVQPENKGEDR